jgi:hypothetical protein
MLILAIRSQLSSAKRERDLVREDNKELKRKQGFATNDLLLQDYEKRKSAIDYAREQIIDYQVLLHLIILISGIHHIYHRP